MSGGDEITTSIKSDTEQSTYPRQRSHLTNEDYLARSIIRSCMGGVQQPRVSVSAAQLKLNPQPAKTPPPPPQHTTPPRRLSSASYPVRPPTVPRPKWVAPFRASVPPHRDEAVLSASRELPHISEIAHTLEELEHGLFTAQGTRTSEGASPAPPERSVRTTEDAVFMGAGAEEKPHSSASPPATEIAESGATTKLVATPSEPVSTESDPILRRWLNSRLPCCYTELTTATEATVRGSSSYLKISRLSAHTFAVRPTGIIPGVEQALHALNEALTFVASHRGPKERDGTKQSAQAVVHLHLGETMAHSSPVSLCVTGAELALTPLRQLQLCERKEQFLRRLRAAATVEDILVIAVVESGAVVSDFAAEVLLCCPQSFLLGPQHDVTVGLPSMQAGALPAPCTVQAVAERLRDHLHADTASPGVISEVLYRLHESMCPDWVIQPALADLSSTSKEAMRDRLVSRATAFVQRWLGCGIVRTAELRDVEKAPFRSLCEHYCSVVLQDGPWRDALLEVLCDAPFIARRTIYSYLMRDIPGRVVPSSLRPMNQVYARSIPLPLVDSIKDLVGEDAAPPAVIMSSDLPRVDRIHWLGTVRAAQGHDPSSCLFVLEGPVAEWDECLSMVPCAAVVSPAAPPLSDSASPHLTSLLAKVREVSLTSATATVAPDHLFRTQAAAVSFLQGTHTPYILTASGEEGLQLAAVLTLGLLRVSRSDVQKLYQVEKTLKEWLQGSEDFTVVLPRYGAFTLSHAARRTRLHSMEVAEAVISSGVLTQMRNEYLRRDEDTTAERAATEAAKSVLADLVNHCCYTLLVEAVDSAEDMALLSLSALRLDPSSGGVLCRADAVLGGVSGWVDFMQERALRTGQRYRAAPLLQWMATEGLNFVELTRDVLARARKEVRVEECPIL